MRISRKKPSYSPNVPLRNYLEKYGRQKALPLTYPELLNSREQLPLFDDHGNDTLWRIMLYSPSDLEYIHKGLTEIYALLKTDGDFSITKHLYIERIDYCTFGNSKPFRIKIVNQFNDNHDYFYVKTADASRIYGLELEHILSPNRLNFLVDSNSDSLIEEHIIGIPGDQFIANDLSRPTLNKVRVAKEFVKFNERCYVRLLGDMRSYNYVIDITPDFDSEQYRVRPIDFDQQSYDWRRSMYLPQYFKENYKIVRFCIETMRPETRDQYQLEERVLMAKRFKTGHTQLSRLLTAMRSASISTLPKIQGLIAQLNQSHKSSSFSSLKNMGEILDKHMRLMLKL